MRDKDRVHNFSAGPATLPLSVLKEIQSQLLDFHGTGMSIVETSHRSSTFEAILENTEATLRKLLNIPSNYKVLFLQGGASLQFCMAPLNLAKPNQTIDFIETGIWSKKAVSEANRLAEVSVIASSKNKKFLELPNIQNQEFDSTHAYLHITSNNTIVGTQYKNFPDTGSLPMVADMSSDILSRPIAIERFGMIYAGTQKNLGISGLALVIIRDDLLERAPNQLPNILKYQIHAENTSLYHTPPTLAILTTSLVTKWVDEYGGLHAMQEWNEKKAGLLYKAIDEMPFFFCPVPKIDRSLMNVVFRINQDNAEDLEKKFVEEASQSGLNGLKGHRSIGGLRASIYNAAREESIQALINFMEDFSKRYSSK